MAILMITHIIHIVDVYYIYILFSDISITNTVTLQKQKWKFHTKIGVFISSHIAPGFWCLQPTEMSGLFTL